MEEKIEDLRKLKEAKVANMLEKVNKLFPNGKPPKNINEINAIIDSWEEGENENLFERLDNRFYEIEEELEQKLESVIRKVISAESFSD